MATFPALIAVTTPVFEPIEATNGSLLLHVPPGVPLLVKVAVAPIQSVAVPEIIPGSAF